MDTTGFSNGHGHGCASYDAHWCADGKAKSGMEWTLGKKFNFPENNCCACGKGRCTDTTGFSNGHGHGCASYDAHWCADGKAKSGMEWTLGKKFKFPEKNCCSCGKTNGKHGSCMDRMHELWQHTQHPKAGSMEDYNQVLGLDAGC